MNFKINESELPELIVERSDPEKSRINDVLSGSQLIIDAEYYNDSMEAVYDHKYKCKHGGKYKAHREIKDGLKSTIVFICNQCDKMTSVHTQDPQNGQQVNTSFVTGAIAIGIGHAQAEEFMTHLDVHTMCSKK